MGALRELRRNQVQVLELRPKHGSLQDYGNLDGVIAHISNTRFRETLQAFKGVVLNTSGVMHTPEFYQVVPDNRAVGRLSAIHLHELGCTHAAYMNNQHMQYSTDRETGFRKGCEELGIEYLGGHLWRKKTDLPASIRKLLKTLGESGGLMTCDDGEAVRVLDYYHQHESFPRAAIISGHDHSTPHIPMITAVDLQEHLWGQTAARVLCQILRGDSPSRKTLIPPTGVNIRGSTSSFRVTDPHLRKAMAFVQDHACSFIKVEDVVQAAGLSRRPLEKRIKEETGLTLLETIHHRQLSEVKRLLTDTHEPLGEVAYLSGMSGEPQLRRLLKRYNEDPPGKIRRVSQRSRM